MSDERGGELGTFAVSPSDRPKKGATYRYTSAVDEVPRVRVEDLSVT